MKIILPEFLKNGLHIFAALFILTAVLVPSGTLAERYHDDQEIDNGYYQVCTLNHLSEDCWERNGSFMNYTQEGFSSCVGIDVSKWNGDIDWELIKEQGVEFVIIRMGYRGYESGELVVDERFYDYIDGASEAGLMIGIYFYSQAISEEEAVDEALFVAEHISGYQVSLPVYFDTEDVRNGQARTEVMATANYNLNARAFCETMESQGYRAGIYASQEWIRKNLDLAQLEDFEIWYASYNTTPGRDYGFDMWQYTDSGELEGCDTYLDMNIRVWKD